MWNQEENHVEADKNVVAALLLVCVKEDDILNHVVNKDVKSFIYGENYFDFFFTIYQPLVSISLAQNVIV